MGVRLVAFDMDGTMLTSDKELPPGIEGEIRRLHDAGIAVAAASGRFYSTIRGMFPGCVDCLSCIGCNGHEVYVEGRQVFSLTFDDDTVRRAVGFARDRGGIVPILFTSTEGQAVADAGDVESWRRRAEDEYGPFRVVSEADLSEPIIKISLFSPQGRGDTAEYMNRRSSALAQDVSWVPTSDWTVDACLEGMNKGRGLAILAERLGVDMADTMAIGDHMNDLEMIRAAGAGVAMANAIPEVKAASDRVSPYTNDEYGVLREFERL